MPGSRPLPGRRSSCARYNSVLRILISAGEASGDMYGAGLIAALRRRSPSLECFGAGGDRMRVAGCHITVDARSLAVVGITEILSHLPTIYGLFRKLIAEANQRRPDLAVVIDSPAFNWRVARQMRRVGIPVVYYVCPQFWAWRQGRVRLLRKYVNKALVIFPFEEKFYCDRGVDATFVGHPLAELPLPSVSRQEFALLHRLDPGKLWITLMPGSRRKEVARNLPTILQSVQPLGAKYQYLLPVASTLADGWMDRQLADLGGRSDTVIVLNRDAYASLYHSRAAIVASGTATVEAALMGTPFVMVYRVSPLTYILGRPRVKVPHFAMVNLIAGREVVPELVQQDFTAAKLVAKLAEILADGPARQTMIAGFEDVRERLRGAVDCGLHPAERAAEAVMNLLGASRNATAR
jgi:lipid-A-disaccharide synthase